MARYSPLRSSPALGHRGQTLRPSPGLAKPLWYPTGATHDQDCAMFDLRPDRVT